MKRVLTYGTFDLFHYGHLELLRRARSLGDYLVVAVSTDKFNSGKGKASFFSFDKRREILESIKYVDKVIPESTWDQKRNDIVENKIDVVVMGDDWDGKMVNGCPVFNELSDMCEVVFLPRTPDISSTHIKALHKSLKNA